MLKAICKKTVCTIAVWLVVIFLLSTAVIWFAYCLPVRLEYDRIAKLPSHDLTLFQNENGQTVYSSVYNGQPGYSSRQDRELYYDGEAVHDDDMDDLLRLFNDDWAKSRDGRYYYFYDAYNSLYLTLDAPVSHFNGIAYFTINRYDSPYALWMEPPSPFARALTLGPAVFVMGEMLYKGDISQARREIFSRIPNHYISFSPLSASGQIAAAFTLYSIPLVLCIVYFSKKSVLLAAGFYTVLFVLNAAYYLTTYSWLNW